MYSLLLTSKLSSVAVWLALLLLQQKCEVGAFIRPLVANSRGSSNPTFLLSQRETKTFSSSRLQNAASFYDDYEDDDDEDDDEEEGDLIDPDSLGDWRNFRRNLATKQSILLSEDDEEEEDSVETVSVRTTSVSKENEEVLSSQSKELAEEYRKGAWCHEVAQPEVGGLVVRMPIEVELYRNHRHSIVGRKLRKKYSDSLALGDATAWYEKAQVLVEEEMQEIANNADDSGQIDSTTLSDESTEMLQIFLDNQENWQEVCLVLERDEDLGTAKALVLNRPMAMKLTDNLSRLVLYGAYQSTTTTTTTGLGGMPRSPVKKVDMVKFMLAFGEECAVYVGGTDDQDHAATIIHGIRALPGAREISPGSGIYEGGIAAAVDGVLEGKYKPLDFRFFVGCHSYDESTLDVAVVLGKYQPVACARSIALKQCISLPKPLWHEVLELCGGHMGEVSTMEMMKRDDILFQVIDEDDEDMLDELRLDEDDDDFYDD